MHSGGLAALPSDEPAVHARVGDDGDAISMCCGDVDIAELEGEVMIFAHTLRIPHYEITEPRASN